MSSDVTPVPGDEILVQRYLEGALSDAEAAEFERRWDQEPALAELLRRYQTLFSVLEDADAHAADGAAQIPAALAAWQAQGALAPESLRWWAAAGGFAAANLFLTGLLVATLQGGLASPMRAFITLLKGVAFAGDALLSADLSTAVPLGIAVLFIGSVGVMLALRDRLLLAHGPPGGPA